MRMRLVLVLSLAFPLVVLPRQAMAQTPPPAAQWVPQDAVICLQVSRPKALLDLLTGKEMTQAVTSSPLLPGPVVAAQVQRVLSTVIKFLETSLETDWRTGLGRLTGGGITVAVCPQDTVVAIVDAQDEQVLQKLHEIFLNITRRQAEKQGHPEKVASKEYGGVTAWTFDGKEAHAIIGKRLIFASRAEGLKTVLDLRGASDGKNLAASPTFQAAQKAANPQAAATVFVNLKPLLGIPNIAGASRKAAGQSAGRTDVRRPRGIRSQLELAEPGARRRGQDARPAGLDRRQDHRADEPGRVRPAAEGGRRGLAEPHRAPADRGAESLPRPARLLRGQGHALSRAHVRADLLREHDGHLLHRPRPDERGPGGDRARGPDRGRRAAV